ncbi:zinc ribbon domain-containing protein [candidate division KSB1 bacterium]|nr:zinc ribbon domain-containing protein [candidate division KSB1 bacterium]
MPTYEYLCANCGHRFEKFQRITAEPEKICPKCQQMTIKRVINGGNGIIFKGSGFYITDYKKGHSSPPTKSDSAASTSSSSDSSSTTKSTTKNDSASK